MPPKYHGLVRRGVFACGIDLHQTAAGRNRHTCRRNFNSPGRYLVKPLTLAAALLLATVNSSSWAQSPVDHDAHHPDQKEAPAATQPTQPAGQPGMGGSQGMKGGGGMMDMMGGKMPMMDMMQMMGMMRQSGAGMGGMATIDHVEGRIAFLRTELKITDAQTGAWNPSADVLRTNAKNLGEVRASMMPQMMPQAGAASQTLVDRLALQEK
jgi:hypothetical protein